MKKDFFKDFDTAVVTVDYPTFFKNLKYIEDKLDDMTYLEIVNFCNNPIASSKPDYYFDKIKESIETIAVENSKTFNTNISNELKNLDFYVGKVRTASNKETLFKIGEKGQAGGIVIFDKRQYLSDGWRYMELAPVKPQSCVWDIIFRKIGLNFDGEKNIKIFMEKFENISYLYWDIDAGQLAMYYSYRYSLNGFRDWFIPNEYEFKVIAKNVKKYGNFSSNEYWTSTEINECEALAYDTKREVLFPLNKKKYCDVFLLRKF
jgi:hypothetical protein